MRIDDSDGERCRDLYLEDIFRCIDWLGLDYDKGPKNVEDQKNNYSQELKREYYFEQLQALKEELFGCECSRKDLQKYSFYPGICQNKQLGFSEGETSLRLKQQRADEFSYMTLWRKDNRPAYQLVSVLEDRDNAITDIIRGNDLLPSTIFQESLFQRFSSKPFANSFHHALITHSDKDKGKLSKSQGDRSLRDQFKTSQDFLEKILWPFLGSDYDGIGLEQLKKLPPDPYVFQKLARV